MADYTPTFGESLPPTMRAWWKELSNGTHALVRYVVSKLQVGGVDVSESNPFPITDSWAVATHEDETLNDVDKQIVCPAGREMQILWVYVVFTSDANAGNRQIQISFHEADTTMFGEVRPGVTQAASLTYRYMFAPSLADLLAVRDTTFMMTPMPPTIILTAGQILRMYNNNPVGAGDDMLVYVQYALHRV